MRISLLLAFAVSLSCARAEPGHVFPAIPADALAAIAASAPRKPLKAPKQPRRVLVFYRTEAFVHQAIPYANEALQQMGKRTGAFEVELSEDLAVFEPERLRRFDAILFNNTTRLQFSDPAHRAAMLGRLKDGAGLIGIHAATDNFPTWPEAQALIGGVFRNHPWVSADTVAVKVDDPTHPLVAAFGGKGFWVRDEIYQITGPYDRAKQRVVLSLDMSKPRNARAGNQIVRTDGDFPISWIKRTEDGTRVFYSSLGHNPDIYSTPQIMEHFLAGIQYALGDLELDATPVPLSASQPALAGETPSALNGPGKSPAPAAKKQK